MKNDSNFDMDEFLCWMSEDLDDWHSFGDYEERLHILIHKYNEDACEKGKPLLVPLRGASVYHVAVLSELNTHAIEDSLLERKLREIKTWAKLRMQSGHADDDLNLAAMSFENGKKLWRAGDYKKAVEALEAAARQGHPYAHFILGEVFWFGLGRFEKDQMKAVEYYKQGVEIGSDVCNLKFGRICLYGSLADKYMPDYGFSLIRKAALQGNRAAAKELSVCYREGRGCEQSQAKADYWNESVLPKSRKRWRTVMEDSGLIGKYLTAAQVHFLVMHDYAYWWDRKRRSWRKRTIPTYEQAKDYIYCVNTLIQYYSNSFPKGAEHLTQEQFQELEERVESYKSLHLDMRDVSYMQNLNWGLKQVTGEILVPPLDGFFTERYDRIEIIRESFGSTWCVPVRKENKYALCMMDGKGTLLTGFIYDRMYRYFGGRMTSFVVGQDGQKGLISQYGGKYIIPCETDEIYEMMDMDGVVPFIKGDKWGMAYGHVCTDALFDELDIQSESYVRGRIGEEWFWIDSKGKTTKNINKRAFGSWSDSSK